MPGQERLDIPDGSRRLLRWVLICFSLVEAAMLIPFVYKLIH